MCLLCFRSRHAKSSHRSSSRSHSRSRSRSPYHRSFKRSDFDKRSGVWRSHSTERERINRRRSRSRSRSRSRDRDRFYASSSNKWVYALTHVLPFMLLTYKSCNTHSYNLFLVFGVQVHLIFIQFFHLSKDSLYYIILVYMDPYMNLPVCMYRILPHLDLYGISL